ncbi:hypothetical protein C6P42_002657 [Pichia californica]|nr:hypothetical protein C6P42_002657 [[Candida] californica]
MVLVTGKTPNRSNKGKKQSSSKNNPEVKLESPSPSYEGARTEKSRVSKPKKNKFFKLKPFPKTIIPVHYNDNDRIIYLVSSKSVIKTEELMFNTKTDNWKFQNDQHNIKFDSFISTLSNKLTQSKDSVKTLISSLFQEKFENTYQTNIFIKEVYIVKFADSIRFNTQSQFIDKWIYDKKVQYKKRMDNSFSIDFLISNINSLYPIYKFNTEKTKEVFKLYKDIKYQWFRNLSILNTRIARPRKCLSAQNVENKNLVNYQWKQEQYNNKNKNRNPQTETMSQNEWCNIKWSEISPDLIIKELKEVVQDRTLANTIASIVMGTNENYMQELGQVACVIVFMAYIIGSVLYLLGYRVMIPPPSPPQSFWSWF